MQKYLKALYGAAIAALGSLYVAYVDNTLSPQEIVGVLISAVSALGVIWAVPNSKGTDA